MSSVPSTLSPARLSATAAKLFAGDSLTQRWRPYICPFEELLPFVPGNSSILDVGCGAGLFLGLLAAEGRIRSGVGFDSAAAAIETAVRMRERAARVGAKATLEFHRLDAAGRWPERQFDVVSIVDVMHHVPRSAQRSVFESAAARVRPDGVLLYKDMARAPAWRAWANRLHDLVLAREWIHYVSIEDVERWARELGLTLVHAGAFNRYWYAHELRVFRRPREGPQ